MLPFCSRGGGADPVLCLGPGDPLRLPEMEPGPPASEGRQRGERARRAWVAAERQNQERKGNPSLTMGRACGQEDIFDFSNPAGSSDLLSLPGPPSLPPSSSSEGPGSEERKRRGLVPSLPRNQFLMKTPQGGSKGHCFLSADLTASVFPIGINSQ